MTNATKNKVYSEQVTMEETMREYLLKCYSNHLDIYNEMVGYFNTYKKSTYKQLKAELEVIMADEAYPEVIKSALCNEIYYLHKKADFLEKNEDDVQYISGIANEKYKGKTFTYNEVEMTLGFVGMDKTIKLVKALPVIEEGYGVYINLSYCPLEDIFEVSVFTSEELNKKDIIEVAVVSQDTPVDIKFLLAA